MKIRKAETSDIPAITEIYNQAIIHTNATFDIEIKTVDNRMEWFKNRNKNFPILVAEIKDKVIGYSALNMWSEKKAYDITAEISLYVDANNRNKGVGTMLLQQIVFEAKKGNLNSLLARITQGNETSIKMHHQVGFKTIGIMQKVGEKFGLKLDVTLLQLMLV